MTEARAIADAADVLRAGGVVACPTETFVGLLADALDAAAIERVAALKGRAADVPIALLLPSFEALGAVAEPLTDDALALARAHWPGPLTLVVRALPGLPARLLRNGTVGVRVPGPSPALTLVRAFGGPLTATSANLSGAPPVRSADELPAALRAGVHVIDGLSPGGAPSTLVDVSGPSPKILRLGALSAARLGLPPS